MLRAIHLRASGLTSEWITALAEMAVSRVRGVAKVVAVRSMGVVSVMFDDSLTNAEKILNSLRQVGLDARPLSANS